MFKCRKKPKPKRRKNKGEVSKHFWTCICFANANLSIRADQQYAFLTLLSSETIMLLQGFGKIICNPLFLAPPFYKADRSTLINLMYVEKVNIKKSECHLCATKQIVTLRIATKKIRDLIKVLDEFNHIKNTNP